MGDRFKDAVIGAYLTAREAIVSRGFGHEIDWQSYVDFESVEESDFLREAAWVVLSSGMKEAVIRKKFPELSLAFLGWCSAEAIVACRKACRRNAMRVFSHSRKIDAIVAIASDIDDLGFEYIKGRLAEQGVAYLESFDFIGPVTRYHLAKNLGLDVVKPDRHLCRISDLLGFSDPFDLCDLIAAETGDRRSVVDIVIWRFATLSSNYLRHFESSRIASKGD